jgi:hypothetical protein
MIRQKINQFFIGRNGQDHFGLFLLVLSVICSFIPLWAFKVLTWVILTYTIFRMVSKNLTARRKENIGFLKVWNKVLRPFKSVKARYNERKFYRVFTCGKCKQKLRVPKYKGRVKVKCTKCGNTFIKKT